MAAFARNRLPRAGASALVAALFVSACAVGPDYERPGVALPATYEASVANDAMTAAVQKDWWRLFGDAALDDLVARALAANNDLLIALARVEEAEGLAREAGASYFPEINFRAGAARTEVSNQNAAPAPAGTPRLRDTRSVGVNTSFEIDLWGRLRRANEAARAELLASRYARDTVELSVASLVVSNYLALRAADADLVLTRSTLESRTRALAIARSRLAGGAASPLDVHQAEGSVAAAEAQLADLRRARALAENALGLFTGTPGLAIAAGDLRALPLPPVPPPGLPSSLLNARPDIRQQEEALISANAQIGLARAAMFPTLSLTGTLGAESAALSNLFSTGASVWSLGMNLALPIFDAGRNAARVDQASARQQQAFYAYRRTVQTAFKEVKDALVSLRESGENELAQERRVQAAQRTLELAQLRYAAGYAAFLEVLDAQRAANDALLAYVATRQARLNSAVDLFKALGGGWSDDFKSESLQNARLKPPA